LLPFDKQKIFKFINNKALDDEKHNEQGCLGYRNPLCGADGCNVFVCRWTSQMVHRDFLYDHRCGDVGERSALAAQHHLRNDCEMITIKGLEKEAVHVQILTKMRG